MPKGRITHPKVCGTRSTEEATAGHPEKFKEEGPICGSSLIELEARLAAIKPKVTSDETIEPCQEN